MDIKILYTETKNDTNSAGAEFVSNKL